MWVHLLVAVMDTKLQRLPKIELHRHLEGSIRFSTMHELDSDLQGLPEAEAREMALVTSPSSGLAAVIQAFERGRQLMNSPERIERITFEVCEDAARDGVTILELRYQPSFIQMDHDDLTLTVIHQAILAGVKRAEKEYPQMCVGLIGIIGRNLSLAIAQETADFILDNRDTFIGVDLANVEIGNCCKDFAPIFKRFHDAGVPITVHQGEEGDPETVRDAVEHLYARRIGHGIQVHKSEVMIEFLKARGIPLEVSVTSNYIVGVVDSIKSHPICALRDAGVAVTINTDDPVLFGDYTLTSEYQALQVEHRWTLEDLQQANQVAYDASFIPEARRAAFWSAELWTKAAQ